MTNFDPTVAQYAFAEKETDELIRIAFLEPDFVPAAVGLARKELARRGIPDPVHERVKDLESRIVLQQREKERLATEALHIGWKIYCFLLADVIALIVALVKFASGKNARAGRR